MRLFHRFLVCCLAFALPLGVGGYYLFSDLQADLEQSRLERKGLAVGKRVGRVISLAGVHQRLSHFQLAGRSNLESERNAVAAQLDNSLAKLMNLVEGLDRDLKIDARTLGEARSGHILPARLGAQWQRLRDELSRLNPIDSDGRHRKLMVRLRGLYQRLGETSGLIRLPDLDAYHLMRMILDQAPQALIRLDRLLIYGQGLIESGRASRHDRIRLATEAHQIQGNDLAEINQAIGLALIEDERFRGVSLSLKKNLKPLLDRYRTITEELIGAVQTLAASNNMTLTPEQLANLGLAAREALDQLWEAGQDELDRLLAAREADLADRRNLIALICLTALLLAVFITWLVWRAIGRSLSRVQAQAQALSVGRLEEVAAEGSIDPEEFDEEALIEDETRRLSVAFGLIAIRLKKLLGQVRESGLQVTSTANQISASARMLEETVSGQATATGQAAEATQEISARSRQLATTMELVGEEISRTADLAGDGHTRLVQMEDVMDYLRQGTGSVAAKLKDISDKTEAITSIVETINQVAEQTNLLSLNAAIEAEKAGEFGVGFSVVAREIRRLSDRSDVASMDIVRMVEEMEAAVTAGVSEVDRFMDRVGQGVEEVEQINRGVLSIIDQIQEFMPRFEALAEVMEHQSEEADVIHLAMSELNREANQIKVSLAEFKAATDQLNHAARSIGEEIAKYRVE